MHKRQGKGLKEYKFVALYFQLDDNIALKEFNFLHLLSYADYIDKHESVCLGSKSF